MIVLNFSSHITYLLLQHIKITYSLPANLYDFLDVDRICATLSWLESDLNKFHFLFMVHKIGSKHDVRNIEILRQFTNIFINELCFHQMERGIGIRHFYSKDHAKKECPHTRIDGQKKQS